MSPHALFTALTCYASAHFVLACVMGLYARHEVKYLGLTWVNIIFCLTLAGASPFAVTIAEGQPGLLHPVMLLVLVVTCYLQSIYPLNISMPGFLQWGRMFKYASPAISLIALYLLAMVLGSKVVILHSFSDIIHHFISGDVLLRVAALCLSLYYTLNIFLLPHRMARHAEVPRYLLGYCTALGVTVVFYTVLTILFNPVLLTVYLGLFTLLNLYLVFRVLESIAMRIPKPVITEIKEEPTEEAVEKADEKDFNEANLYRFNRVEFWMQNNKEEWKDNTFGRDQLCRMVGYNRHLLLQCVRSQGYNNVHDYINSYRIAELKLLIQSGRITTVTECTDAGFGTMKTARSCFERMEGIPLDKYFNENRKDNPGPIHPVNPQP